MIIQNQFPLGKPIPMTNSSSGISGLSIIIICSAIMLGGAFYYYYNTKIQNENKKN